MGYSGSPATVVRNNRNMLSSANKSKAKRTKRIYKAKEVNPKIKNMSKKELKAYRAELQKQASFKLKAFWISFMVLFVIMFIYLIVLNNN